MSAITRLDIRKIQSRTYRTPTTTPATAIRSARVHSCIHIGRSSLHKVTGPALLVLLTRARFLIANCAAHKKTVLAALAGEKIASWKSNLLKTTYSAPNISQDV